MENKPLATEGFLEPVQFHPRSFACQNVAPGSALALLGLLLNSSHAKDGRAIYIYIY